MANRINSTYFESGMRFIPNLDQIEILSSLNSSIDLYEPQFFIEMFGYEFQKEMIENPTETKYNLILAGGEWIDSLGYTQNWEGINNSIADYVYFYFIKENIVKLSGNGYMFGTNENSNIIQPITTPLKVWNRMTNKIAELYNLITTNISDYDRVLFNINLDYINEFGF